MLELAAQALKIKLYRAEFTHHGVVTGMELPHWEFVSAVIYVFNIGFPIHNSFLPASNPDSGDGPRCRLPHRPRAERGLRVGDPDSLQAHTLRRPHVGASCHCCCWFSCWHPWRLCGWPAETLKPVQTSDSRAVIQSCTELSPFLLYRRTGLALVKYVAFTGT